MSSELKNRRARNLGYIRWRRGGHIELARQLGGLVNRKYLSDYILGDRTLADHRARAFETKLCYPKGFLDRDNFSAAEAAEGDFELFALVQKAPPDIKAAIHTILQAYQ